MLIKFYIPTYLRPERQRAYAQLSAAGLDPVLVVDKRDEYPYKEFNHIRGDFRSIADKRMWIMMNAPGPYTCMVDDDVDLHVVKPRIKLATAADLKRMVKLAEQLLSQYAHVNLHRRMFVNYAPQPYITMRGHLPIQVVFHNRALFKRPPTLTPFSSCSDAWVAIQLLQQGLPYATITQVCLDDRLSQVSHFTQQQKRDDFERTMRALKVPAKFYSEVADGLSLRYAAYIRYCMENA